MTGCAVAFSGIDVGAMPYDSSARMPEMLGCVFACACAFRIQFGLERLMVCTLSRRQRVQSANDSSRRTMNTPLPHSRSMIAWRLSGCGGAVDCNAELRSCIPVGSEPIG